MRENEKLQKKKKKKVCRKPSKHCAKTPKRNSSVHKKYEKKSREKNMSLYQNVHFG